MCRFLVLHGKLPVSFFHYMTVFVRTDRNILGWWADSSRWSLLKPQRLKSWWLNAANSLPLANTCFQFWKCRVFERNREWKVLWSAQLSKAQILHYAEGKNNLQQILKNRRVGDPACHEVSREWWNLQADVLKQSSFTLLRLLHYSALPPKINCALSHNTLSNPHCRWPWFLRFLRHQGLALKSFEKGCQGTLASTSGSGGTEIFPVCSFSSYHHFSFL